MKHTTLIHTTNTAVPMFFHIKHKLYLTVVALCLVLTTGCADVKVATRDANYALMEVIALSELDEIQAEEQLFSVENRILVSCHSLFTNTDFFLHGEGIPILTQLDAILSASFCQETVNDALQELYVLKSSNYSF